MTHVITKDFGVVNVADSVKNVDSLGEQAWKEWIIQSYLRKP
jgi:hypothetical protein